ncbi:hypothetical protein VTI74DRAFT_1166 [Chaetomium olivicolor]
MLFTLVVIRGLGVVSPHQTLGERPAVGSKVHSCADEHVPQCAIADWFPCVAFDCPQAGEPPLGRNLGNENQIPGQTRPPPAGRPIVGQVHAVLLRCSLIVAVEQDAVKKQVPKSGEVRAGERVAQGGILDTWVWDRPTVPDQDAAS